MAFSRLGHEALISNNGETQLVVYPGMFHGPSAPSRRYDIMLRFIHWWERFVTAGLP